jgi:hypothetical protein
MLGGVPLSGFELPPSAERQTRGVLGIALLLAAASAPPDRFEQRRSTV